MLTNPSAKAILCYGDSNTWGVNPVSHVRFAADKRWTGVMQHALGDQYNVIEEGLPGRTTMYSDSSKPWQNGKTFFPAVLATHAPLHMVIMLLGTNDTKVKYSVDDTAIGIGMEDLMQIIHTARVGVNGTEPKTLIIAPPVIKDFAAKDERFVDGPRKSTLFAERYQAVAARNNALFLNAGEIIASSDADGYHFDEAAHQKLGIAVSQLVKQTLG